MEFAWLYGYDRPRYGRSLSDPGEKSFDFPTRRNPHNRQSFDVPTQRNTRFLASNPLIYWKCSEAQPLALQGIKSEASGTIGY
ncbi:hypothetical protein CHS0354_024428 [Potamilus streckersoni]|uniref:Uncharacterized protein n=1 Tax=Potamilus streckersoni TaxID=2493646 RepID=A0AAE0SWU4_9BIVA|nr:hypothetical protein CHS0354_024428 [Potamilus streckersoni]